MQVIKTLTAINGVNSSYFIKRVDDQPIQPNWIFKWEILDSGAGTIVSSDTGNLVVIVWTENTDPGQLFTLKVTVDMGSCVRELGIKVKVISENVVLVSSLEEEILNQCTREENGSPNIGARYIAICQNASRIIWDIIGGQFKKSNNSLVSGPIQEIPDGDGKSIVRVVWNNSGPPFKLTAKGSINNQQQFSNTSELDLFVLPSYLRTDWSGPITKNYGSGNAIYTFSIFDINRLPNGTKNMGDTKIDAWLYIGSLKDGHLPNSDEDFEGEYWINGDRYYNIIDTYASLVNTNTLTTNYSFPIPDVHTPGAPTYFRLKWRARIQTTLNDCSIESYWFTKDLELKWCESNVALGNIIAINLICPENIITGNIIAHIPDCPTVIIRGNIYTTPGLYDPNPFGDPFIEPIYIPWSFSYPTIGYIYTPEPFSNPVIEPIYIPWFFGDPIIGYIYIPNPFGLPNIIKFYIPLPFGVPNIIKFYIPLPFGVPNIIKFYTPNPFGAPNIIKFYIPLPFGVPNIIKFYIPFSFGLPKLEQIYIPNPFGLPNIIKFYIPNPFGLPNIIKFYIPNPFGTPVICENGYIYIPVQIGTPNKYYTYRPKAYRTPYCVTHIVGVGPH